MLVTLADCRLGGSVFLIILPSLVFFVAVSLPALVELSLRFHPSSIPRSISESTVCLEPSPAFNERLIWCNRIFHTSQRWVKLT